MTADLGTLSVSAVRIGLVHCRVGPDHYLPFVAMARAGLWSFRKTMLVTFLCGVAHVASSAALGFLGIALGVVVFHLETAEKFRGDLAGWLLIAFGLAYSVWGVVHAARSFSTHREARRPGQEDHQAHGAMSKLTSGKFTPWILFLVFLFGPCEPLIPLLMYPAANASIWGVVCVVVLFSLTTLVTMTSLVALIYFGAFKLRLQRAEPYGHAMAGLTVLGCGVAIMFGM